MNNYLPDDFRPMSEQERDRLVETLLTIDGKGREAKREALDRLLENAASTATYLVLKHEGLL